MKNQLKKLANLFPYADKVMHFIGGALISLIICLIINDPAFGFAGSMIAGGYKEYSDHVKGSHAGGIQSILDFLSTCAGGAFIALLF
jgi:TRAP-type C4-dicarboxylate transport system permease small subunit